MRASKSSRLPGAVPATIAAVVTFATTALYVAIIVSQGDVVAVRMIVIATYSAGLGVSALLGASRTRSDRVVLLGIASGGLIGAGIVAILSIGLLFLVAGFCALAAWMRAGVGASARDQLLGGIGGAAAAIGFLVVALIV